VRQVRWTVGPGSPVWTGGPGRTRNRPYPESSAAATPRVNTIRERPACPGALAARLLTTLWTTLAYHCVPAPVQSPALGSSTPATLTATSRRALGPSRDSDRRAPAAAVAHAGPGGGVRPRRHETRSRGALACDAVRLSSRATGKLGFALADVAALPRAALVVGDRYSQIFTLQHGRPAVVLDGLAERRCAGRMCPSCSARPGRWPRSGPTGTWPPPTPGAVTEPAARARIGHGVRHELRDASDAPEPATAEVRAWARANDIPVADRGASDPKSGRPGTPPTAPVDQRLAAALSHDNAFS
jgi:hypothetical protein